MDQERLRIEDIIDGRILRFLSKLFTVKICTVTKVNATTINCKPVVNRYVDGESTEYPEFQNLPPIHLIGGTSYVAMPITEGDDAVVFFADRSLDTWWNGLKFLAPPSLRMHSLSDGIAFVGVKNQLAGIPIPSKITLNGAINLGDPAPADMVALASKVETQLTAIVTALNAFITIFDAHTHTAVTPGVGVSGTTATPGVPATPPGPVASLLVGAD